MINKVMFIGCKEIGFTALECIYATAPEKLISIVSLDDHKENRSRFNEFIEFSKKNNVKLHMANKPSSLSSIIQSEKPELCIVEGWYWILKPNVLQLTPKGFLGIHASLLPKYRGSAPLTWPIINGDKESGVTLFYYDEGLDSGDIVGQRKFPIAQDDTIGHVIEKAEASAIKILNAHYPLILDETAKRSKQDHSEATYGSRRKPEDANINWNASHTNIFNLIRAQTYPYQGAYSFYKGKQIRIIRASLFQYPYYGIPGLVSMVTDNSVTITCGSGAINVYEVSIADSVYEAGSLSQPATQVLKYGMLLSSDSVFREV